MKEYILQAIKKVKDIIEYGIKSEFLSEDYMPIYMFTTENIKGVSKAIDVKGKDVLTVCASSDHEFNFLLNGAKSVETFDVNYLTNFYYYFKESAILTLEYQEFIDFFFPKFNFSFKKKTFNSKTFKKIVDNIRDEGVKVFWNALNDIYGSEFLYSSNLFNLFYNKNTYIECNDYLQNEENYNKLKIRLKTHKHKFYYVNIFDSLYELPEDKKYQVIYLSNIMDRVRAKSQLGCFRKIKKIIEELKNNLCEGGILGVCYLYCYLDEEFVESTPNNILNPDFRREYFPDSKDDKSSEYCYHPFNGFNDIKGRRIKNMDAVMLTRGL